MTRNRALALGGVAVGLAFALFGGEYTVTDWREMRRRLAVERETIDRLRREIDSLQRLAEALETDPATQEREARERFGMLRPGERIYRLNPGPRGESAPPGR